MNVRRMEKKKNIQLQYDMGILAHLACMKYGLINIEYDFKELFSSISVYTREDDPEKILMDAINNLEILIKDLAEKFSIYEMIYFSRRIKPENVFACADDEILLYRNTMMLVFQKYCKLENKYFLSQGQILPTIFEGMDIFSLTDILTDIVNYQKFAEVPVQMQMKLTSIAQVFKACYLVEYYSFYYVYLMKTYRNVCKGARLQYQGKYGISSVIDEELQQKITLFDERNKHYNIISTIGGYVDINTKNEEASGLGDYIILEYQENAEVIRLDDRLIPNYFPVPISLRDYYQYIINFKGEFKEHYGFSIEDFLVFMIIITRTNVINMTEKNEMFYMFQQAYKVYCYKRIRENFLENCEEVHNAYGFKVKGNKEEIFERIFHYLCLTEDDKEKIDLKSQNHRKMFIKLDADTGIIDFTSWGSILNELLIEICKDNDKKGNVFEKIVLNKVKEEFGDDSIWATQRQIKVGKKEREIDVSFVLDNMLIILECKALNLSRSFYVNDKKVLSYREMKNKGAVAQADKTLDFIEENKNKLNIKLPQSIDAIVSLVVTPAPEYIWELNDNLMINEKLPRILCIDELKELKKASVRRDMMGRNFYRKL